MAFKYLIITMFLGVCANANAEWFLRGTQNDWAATQMESAGANTVQLNAVVFGSAGSIKFDRYGDWKESYGNGSGNIAVAAGVWDIKFYTDTKRWNISAPQALSTYHLRGTNNGWAEGTLLARGAAADTYELCVNFTAGDGNGGPRFKIDPNGGWGDAIPAADFVVTAGWVKVSFNSSAKIVTTQQNLAVNCAGTVSSPASASSVVFQSSAPSSAPVASSVASVGPASIYHLRGTFNGWAEGALMARIGNTDNYKSCINFAAGDNNGGPRFKVDPNGGWGDAIPAADVAVSAGWVNINFNSVSKQISTQQNLAANCASSETVSSSSLPQTSQASQASSSQAAATSIYHVRGTFNSWVEGTLLSRIGTTDIYERCVNFAGGDGNGGPRFKIDPSGGWGDAIPAADFVVTAGWVKITYNSSSKNVSVQQNLPEHCAVPAASSVSSSSSSTATPTVPYHIRGTFNNWLEGTLMSRIGSSDNYQYCVNFNQASNRFKVDPNGGWGDALPAADFIVSAGWVNIVFNSATKAISVQQNLAVNCGVASSSSSSAGNPEDYFFAPEAVYHVRGDFNGWAEGALLMQQIYPTYAHKYQACVNFSPTAQRFRIDKNGGWGIDVLPMINDASFQGNGWTLIELNRLTGQISVTVGLEARCVDYRPGGQILPFPPDKGVPSPPLPVKAFVPIHIRGTNNAFAEGTLMTQIGSTDNYTACVRFTAGDANGGPRFRIDPNGGWGDAVPAADVNVGLGWVAIGFNNTTKQITKRSTVLAECQLDTYRLMGTQRKILDYNRSIWTIGDFFEPVDGNSQLWKICRDFGSVGDEEGGPRFRIVTGMGGLTDDLNGPEGPPTIPASGWTSITFASPVKEDGSLRAVDPENTTVTTNMAPNCSAP